MYDTEFDTAPAPQRPRTATVLGLFAVAATVLSYLLSYAMANALVAAEVLKPFTRDHDPRPRWFLFTFVLLIVVFSAVGALVRFVSARNLKQIEAMEAEE